MNQKKIFIFIYLLFSAVFLAEKPGFPGTEMQLFRIVPPAGQTLGNQKPIPDSWLKPLGRSKTSIANVLKDLELYSEMEETGRELLDYKSGPAFWFWPEDPNDYDAFSIGGNGDTHFLMSKRWQLRVGGSLPSELYNYEYTSYIRPGNIMQFVFDIATPQGGFASYRLLISTQNGKIINIHYGGAQ